MLILIVAHHLPNSEWCRGSQRSHFAYCYCRSSKREQLRVFGSDTEKPPGS